MKTLVLIIIVSLALPVKMQAQDNLTLEKCREMALENNMQMKVALHTKDKSAYEVKSYRSNYLPKISASGNYMYSDSKMEYNIEGGYLPTYVPDASGNLVPNIQTILPDGTPIFKEYAYMPNIPFNIELGHVYLAGIKAEQPIYSGGKITAAYKMSLLGREMSELNETLTRSEVLVKTDEAYWTHVKVSELLKSARKYKEVVEELFRNVGNAHESGMSTQNDVLKVQVKLNEAELQLRQAENALRLSRMNLCHIIGLPLSTSIQLSDSFAEEEPLLIDKNADISGRPEFVLLNKQVELKQQQTKLVRSDYMPNAGVMAAYNYGHGVKINNETLLDKAAFSAVVSVNIPLFHWGDGRNKVKAAKMEQEIAEAQRKDFQDKMELELVQAINTYDEALLEVEMTTRSLSQAEENMKVSKDKYDLGMETLVNYLEAQTVWQKAWSDMIDAKASLKFSETYYLKASGKL